MDTRLLWTKNFSKEKRGDLVDYLNVEYFESSWNLENLELESGPAQPNLFNILLSYPQMCSHFTTESYSVLLVLMLSWPESACPSYHFHIVFHVPSSSLWPFLIQHLLKWKSLFSKHCLDSLITSEYTPLQIPSVILEPHGNILDFAVGAVLQVVSNNWPQPGLHKIFFVWYPQFSRRIFLTKRRIAYSIKCKKKANNKPE